MNDNTMSGNRIMDPKTYQQCLTPRPRDVVDESLYDFQVELAALRVKHGIAELVCIVEARVDNDQPIAMVMNRGDERLHPHLLAAAYVAMTGKTEVLATR